MVILLTIGIVIRDDICKKNGQKDGHHKQSIFLPIPLYKL